MHNECNIIAYDINYNRATTENKAMYFENAEKLLFLLTNDFENNNNSQDMVEISKRRYTWDYVSRQYNALY